MAEQRGMLVPSLAETLEPAGETSVEPRALRLGETRVRDLTRERVLDRVLALARHRGARAATDEVALLENAEIRLEPVEQLVDRAGPENAADHRCRLEGCLLGGLEQVDAGGQHSLDGVRHLEAGRELAER